MRGLIIKDLKLIFLQKGFIFLSVIWLIALSIINDELIFLLAFIPYILSILTVSTISYDSFDNGYPFLFTLPFKRRDYVMTKYLLAVLMFVAGNLLTLTFVFLSELVLSKELMELWDWLNTFVISFIGVLIFLSVMLPSYFKYGSEKARIINILIVGLVLVVLYGVKNLLEQTQLIDSVLTLDTNTIFVAGSVLAIIIYVVSLLISIRIIYCKEF